VVSTPIRDVVRPYGERGLVRIAEGPDAFVRAIEEALRQERASWLPAVDQLLAAMSWDATWRGMKRLVDDVHAAPSRQRARSAVGVAP
jgi:hypothetical protein